MIWQNRPNNKFNARKVVWKGEVYDSRKEAEYAMWLESERQAKRLKWWRRQIPVRMEVNGKLICKLIIDFKVCYPDGRQEYHEVKSKATKTPIYNLKLKLFRALFPDEVYRTIE